jgi:hypothetical protein
VPNPHLVASFPFIQPKKIDIFATSATYLHKQPTKIGKRLKRNFLPKFPLVIKAIAGGSSQNPELSSFELECLLVLKF